MVAEPPNKDDPGAGADQATTWIAPDPEQPTSWIAPDPEQPEAEPELVEAEPVAPTQPSPVAPQPAAVGRNTGVALMLSGVLLVLVAAGAAYLSWPLWNQGLPGWLRGAMAPVMDAGRNTALGSRVDALEARLAGLEVEVRSGRQDSDKQTLAAIGKLARRLGETETGLGSRIATLELEAAKSIVASEEKNRPTSPDALEPLARRLAALETGLAELAARPDPAPAPAPAPAGPDPALDRLRTDNRSLAASMAALTRRLAALEGRPMVNSVPLASGSLLLAVGQLRDGLRNSGPFRRELDGVAGLAAGDDKALALVAELAPHASGGIGSLATLSAGFPAMAARVAQAALAPGGGGWIDQTIARLSRIITIRRTGAGVEGESAGAHLARAETRLKAGDLDGAMAELSGLKGAPAAAAGDWLATARARLGAEDAVSRLTAHVIAGLGTSSATGPAAGKPGG